MLAFKNLTTIDMEIPRRNLMITVVLDSFLLKNDFLNMSAARFLCRFNLRKAFASNFGVILLCAKRRIMITYLSTVWIQHR